MTHFYKMATTVIGNGPSYSIYYPDESEVSPLSEFQKIIVDGGEIILDKAAHNDNFAHLYLSGALQSHEAYVKIKNAGGTELFKIDYTGKLYAPQGIVAPEITTVTTATTSNTASITSLTSSVGSNTSTISTISTQLTANSNSISSLSPQVTSNTLARNGATASAIDSTLVLRDNNNGTHFATLTSNIVNVGQACALYGDANIQWVAQDSQGNNLPGTICRFGRNHEELGDTSGAGDGLELIGRTVAGAQRNKIELFPHVSSPSLQMINSKNAGIPWVRLKTHDGSDSFEIDQYGISQIYNNSTAYNLSPGNNYTGVLERGFNQMTFTLSGHWTPASGDIILILKSPAFVKDYIIKQLEIAVDQSSLNSYIQSVVYVDRYTKHLKQSPTESEVRIVLKQELLGAEVNIPSNTILTPVYLNSKVL